MFPNQVNIKDLFTNRPSEQFNKVQRESRYGRNSQGDSQRDSQRDSAFGGYHSHSQELFSQPLSQSNSNIYSQPAARSQQAGDGDDSPASSFCKSYSNKIQPKISETKRTTKLQDYQQQMQPFKEQAKEKEKWSEVNDMFSFVKQCLMEVHTTLDRIEKGNSEVQHRSEQKMESFKQSMEKKLEYQNASILEELKTSNTMFEKRAIATNEQINMSDQKIQQLVEQFKDLKEDIPDQIMDKLKLHCSGLENNVTEKMIELHSENKVLLQEINRKQNTLKDNVQNMLTTIANRISESDKKMFDIEDRCSSKLITFLDEFSDRYKEEFDKRELILYDKSKETMHNIVATVKQDQTNMSKLLTTAMKSNSENLRNLHYQILTEMCTKYGEERSEVKDLICAEFHKYSSLFTDNTADVLKQLESIGAQTRDAQAKLNAEQGNLCSRNSSNLHNIQSLGPNMTLLNNDNQKFNDNANSECVPAYASKSVFSPVAVIEPFARNSEVEDEGSSSTNTNNTVNKNSNRNSSRYLPITTDAAHPKTTNPNATHPRTTHIGAAHPAVSGQGCSQSGISQHRMNLRSCKRNPHPFVKYVDNSRIVHNNNIFNLRREGFDDGSPGTRSSTGNTPGSSTDEDCLHLDVFLADSGRRSESSMSSNPVQNQTNSASRTANKDSKEGTHKLGTPRDSVVRGRISKRPKRQLLPMAAFNEIFHRSIE